SRLVRSALREETFELYGDGKQTRDFTFVDDVVHAMRGASRSPWCGVANIGGGARTSMNRAIEIMEELCGPVSVTRRPPQQVDVRHTAADISVARSQFGYRPRVSLEEGLKAMVSGERLHDEVMAR